VDRTPVLTPGEDQWFRIRACRDDLDRWMGIRSSAGGVDRLIAGTGN
jgi:hypothetical protein